MPSLINLCDLDDRDLSGMDLVVALIDVFKLKTNRLPDALVVTGEQARKYFLANGQIMPDFRGIPLFLEKKSDEVATVTKTINSILEGMHTKRVKDVADVYANLENMKMRVLGVNKESAIIKKGVPVQ